MKNIRTITSRIQVCNFAVIPTLCWKLYFAYNIVEMNASLIGDVSDTWPHWMSCSDT
jgi:hypothetical protein